MRSTPTWPARPPSCSRAGHRVVVAAPAARRADLRALAAGRSSRPATAAPLLRPRLGRCSASATTAPPSSRSARRSSCRPAPRPRAGARPGRHLAVARGPAHGRRLRHRPRPRPVRAERRLGGAAALAGAQRRHLPPADRADPLDPGRAAAGRDLLRPPRRPDGRCREHGRAAEPLLPRQLRGASAPAAEVAGRRPMRRRRVDRAAAIVYCAREERGALRIFLRALRKLPLDLPWEADVWIEDASIQTPRLNSRLRERVRILRPADASRGGADRRRRRRLRRLGRPAAGAEPDPRRLRRRSGSRSSPRSSPTRSWSTTTRASSASSSRPATRSPSPASSSGCSAIRGLRERIAAAGAARPAPTPTSPISSRRSTAGSSRAATTRPATPRCEGGSRGGGRSTATCTCTPTTRTTARPRSRCCSRRRRTAAWARSRSPTTTRSRARSRRARPPSATAASR